MIRAPPVPARARRVPICVQESYVQAMSRRAPHVPAGVPICAHMYTQGIHWAPQAGYHMCTYVQAGAHMCSSVQAVYPPRNVPAGYRHVLICIGKVPAGHRAGFSESFADTIIIRYHLEMAQVGTIIRSLNIFPTEKVQLRTAGSRCGRAAVHGSRCKLRHGALSLLLLAPPFHWLLLHGYSNCSSGSSPLRKRSRPGSLCTKR